MSPLTVPVFKNTSCSFCCTQTNFELIINTKLTINTKVSCYHIFDALYPMPVEMNESLKLSDPIGEDTHADVIFESMEECYYQS